MQEEIVAQPVRHQPQTTALTHLIRFGILTATLIAVIAIGSLIFQVGWDGALNACSTEEYLPDGATQGTAAHRWTWVPLGYTCTWDNGASLTKLWW